MTEEDEEGSALVGVSLTSEMGCHGNKEHDSALGFILLDVDKMTVMEMREAMQKQVEAMPASFRFLTKQGWPVTSTQESMIKVKHLINDDGVVRIQPDYAKPRVGVSTEKGKPLGFVFVSTLSLPISQLREAILAQLGGSHQLPLGEWVFVDRNFWPICSQQEEAMTIIDILSGACVRLHFLDSYDSETEVDGLGGDRSLAVSTPLNRCLPSSPRNNDNGAVMLALSHGTYHRPLSPIPHGDSFLTKSLCHQAKQILISYVRAEASQYALDLKRALEVLNFSVYLDVHEIFSGTDWQDSLNYAVTNCEVFVPLVTPRYGETQWTNRELKLADVLNKYIVPVSFVETWPPCCLAIQFATTQFINWRQGQHNREKIFRLMADKSEVFYSWSESDVSAVSKDIGTRCLTHAGKKLQEQREADKSPMLRSYPSALPPGLPTNMTVVTESREGAPMVVISVHPKQQQFGDILKKLFEAQGYEVWCTTELDDMTNSCSQTNLTDDDSTLPVDELESLDSGDNPTNPIAVLQKKAAEAGVIVFVLSKAFADSDTCKQQVFYCERRKRVIPLKYEEFEMPGWMSMLIGTSQLEDVQRADYEASLLTRVKSALSPQEDDTSDADEETKLTSCMDTLCNKLPSSNCVYISGGTRFYYKNSEAICKEIGISLGRLDHVTLVTGGFSGVGETVARSFFDERQRMNKREDVWHILPVHDDQDRSLQTRQNKDKTFEPVSFGETIFIGDSVRQRETVVSRVFDICILVEGGPGAAHEAEEFTWSDHTVIPIKCTEGAAGGKFNVPQKIFECPPGVLRDDWNQLANKNESPAAIGAAVARIITALQQDVSAQMTRLKTFVDRRASDVKT